MQSRRIFVIGMESSGSKLVAKILSHALDIRPYGTWNGSGWSLAEHSPHGVYHRSQPYGAAQSFSDVRQWNEAHRGHAIHYVICTRDTTISERSRGQRWPRRRPEFGGQTCRAREIIRDVLATSPSTIWSYETFMFLGSDYVRHMYRCLGVDSDFVPDDVVDANRKHVRRAA